MRLVVVRETGAETDETGEGMLAYAFSTDPLQKVVLNGARRLAYGSQGQLEMAEWIGPASASNMVWGVPASWQETWPADVGTALGYTAQRDICPAQLERIQQHPWFTISNGRFAAQVNAALVAPLLQGGDVDALAIMATPDLLAYREHVRLTQQDELVGYRRLYRDTVQPMPLPQTWPHHFLIKSEHVDAVFADGFLGDFHGVVERCRQLGLNVRAVAMAGCAADLGTAKGWLTLSEMMAEEGELPLSDAGVGHETAGAAEEHDQQRETGARVIGPVLIGPDVCLEPGAVIIGPSILCQGSTVRRDAVVDTAVLGAQGVVEQNEILKDAFAVRPDGPSSPIQTYTIDRAEDECDAMGSDGGRVFREWPLISYAGCLKRIIDIVVAAIVLVLFVPVIPVMALAIKISSPGPVFFRDKRQGLHGRLFDCFKFRTMRVGAADIQDKLRFVCEVDGPQFKMTDDPRISTVGRFLRETYLDEIPQFFNVLCGQMSVVGPRPSPESENTLCPSWRDARLSVRPGITGLWQVNRTRRPFKDFQEWIYYDMQYVRELSPRTDLWICWRTFMKMIENFIHQF